MTNSTPYLFNDQERSIRMNRLRLPAPWINYLSNGSLHAFVSQAGGGMLWWRSPLSFRLTRYRMYNLPLDSPGFYLYIREADGTVWSPTLRPCSTVVDDRYAEHLPGRSRFVATRGDLSVSLELFIAPDSDTLIWDVNLTNSGGEAVELDLFAYVEYSLQAWREETDWGCYVKHNLNTNFDEQSESVLYLYHHNYHKRTQDIPLVFLASGAKVSSWSGDRDAFIGQYRDERDPQGIENNNCGNSEMTCGEPCGALQCKVRLEPGTSQQVPFFIGAVSGALHDYEGTLAKARQQMEALRAPGAIEQQREALNAWWEKHLQTLQCELPDTDLSRQINIWTPVQCVHTGRYSRSISFYASGIRGIGFRDTCQDMIAIAPRDPQWATEMLLYQLSQQFEDGHAVHTSYPEEVQPPATSVHCDDHLWLPLLAHAVLAETGDLSLLEQQVPFLQDDASGAGKSASVWQHLLACVDFTESNLGEHGLPLIFKSDWNDIIGKFSQRGKGESVFAAQQYVYGLRLLENIAEAMGDEAARTRLQETAKKQIAAINQHAWDGEWWRRAFDDDGVPVGSRDSSFGQIWINSQSWAVLSQCGDKEKQLQGMDSMRERLNTPMGLRKLAPGFPTWPETDDPFSGYSPGCGENAAIFCHAQTWAIIAEALLGRADRAWEYYRQLVPHLACERIGIDRYIGEPYAYASNIVGPENSKFGWANVTQVTGAAAWMEIAATQYLLGVRPELGGLRIDPCLPSEWKSVQVTRLFRGCRVEVEFNNSSGTGRNVTKLTLDGEELSGNFIPAQRLDGRETVRVLATLG